jgi:hypothetical protein
MQLGSKRKSTQKQVELSYNNNLIAHLAVKMYASGRLLGALH